MIWIGALALGTALTIFLALLPWGFAHGGNLIFWPFAVGASYLCLRYLLIPLRMRSIAKHYGRNESDR